MALKLEELDPTTIRLSDSLLLSDFMGCDSAYRHGYANPFYNEDLPKLAEGFLLAQKIEYLQSFLGICSISYGYIAPELSAKIVKYQNPDKPSYHRWDHGAAADLCFHRRLDKPPILTAFEIDEHCDYSRMITYAESEWICFASRLDELGQTPRKALYENRFVGKREPNHIKYSFNQEKRKQQIKAHTLDHDWRGGGHPSYHGKGVRQLQHLRAGTYSLWSDFLYYAPYVAHGKPNNPLSLPTERYHKIEKDMNTCAGLIEALVEEYHCRFSIVRGLVLDDNSSNWERNGVSLVIVPPASRSTPEQLTAIKQFIANKGWTVDKPGRRKRNEKTNNTPTIRRITCHAN